MEDAWSISSESITDKNTLGFQIKALIDGEHKKFDSLSFELKCEHAEWERQFPNLAIVGKKISLHSNAANEKQRLKIAVANQLVRLHLWPEMKRILQANSISAAFSTRDQRTKRPCNLPKLRP